MAVAVDDGPVPEDASRSEATARGQDERDYGADELFSAWLRGDTHVVEEALKAATEAAKTRANKLVGRSACLRGESAGDIASDAVTKFKRAIESGRLQDTNLTGYLMRIVMNRFRDLLRVVKREATSSLDAARKASRSRDVAGDAGSPADVLRRRQALVAWCTWPVAMWPACARRPALREMLKLIHVHMKLKLGATTAAGLTRLAETVNPEAFEVDAADLNAFLLADLDIGRNALDLRWRELKRISVARNVPPPPGLMRDKRRRSMAPAAVPAEADAPELRVS